MSKDMKQLMEGLQTAVDQGSAIPDVTLTEEEISEIRKWWGTDSYKGVASDARARGEEKAATTDIDVSGSLTDVNRAAMKKRIEVVSGEIQQTIDDLRALDIETLADEALDKILAGDEIYPSHDALKTLAARAIDDVRHKKGKYFLSLLKYIASWRFARDGAAVGGMNYLIWTLMVSSATTGTGALAGVLGLVWFFIAFPLSFMLPTGGVQATQRDMYDNVDISKHRDLFKKQMAERLEGLISYLEAEKENVQKGNFSGLGWGDRKGSDEDYGRSDPDYGRDVWNSNY